MLHAKSQKKSLLQLLDIGGVILFTIGLFVLLLGISWGGEQYSWDSGQVIGTIVGGGMLLIVFTFYGSCAIRGPTVKKRQRISLLTKLEILYAHPISAHADKAVEERRLRCNHDDSVHGRDDLLLNECPLAYAN
jgi:hypothetical protein